MKSVLLALAVILTCVAYEIDRGARLWADWQTQAAAGADFGGQAAETTRIWIPRGGYDGGPVLRVPRDAADSAPAAGPVEREHSIRLFGPGVSRQRQIRV